MIPAKSVKLGLMAFLTIISIGLAYFIKIRGINIIFFVIPFFIILIAGASWWRYLTNNEKRMDSAALEKDKRRAERLVRNRKEAEKRANEHYIKICPKCQSKEVVSRGAITRNAVSPDYLCKSCGYQSPIFPEMPLEEAAKLPDHPRRFTPTMMPILSDAAPVFNWRTIAGFIGLILLFFLFWLLLNG